MNWIKNRIWCWRFFTNFFESVVNLNVAYLLKYFSLKWENGSETSLIGEEALSAKRQQTDRWKVPTQFDKSDIKEVLLH